VKELEVASKHNCDLAEPVDRANFVDLFVDEKLMIHCGLLEN